MKNATIPRITLTVGFFISIQHIIEITVTINAITKIIFLARSHYCGQKQIDRFPAIGRSQEHVDIWYLVLDIYLFSANNCFSTCNEFLNHAPLVGLFWILRKSELHGNCMNIQTASAPGTSNIHSRCGKAFAKNVNSLRSEFRKSLIRIYLKGAGNSAIILYKALGLLTPDTVKSVILLIPFTLLGLFTGIKCCGHINDSKVRKITTVLLILSGISLVLKNL